VSVAYDPAAKTITLHRLASLNGPPRYVPLTQPAKPYRLVIGGVKDTDGNTFAGYSFTFTG